MPVLVSVEKATPGNESVPSEINICAAAVKLPENVDVVFTIKDVSVAAPAVIFAREETETDPVVKFGSAVEFAKVHLPDDAIRYRPEYTIAEPLLYTPYTPKSTVSATAAVA